MVDFARLKAEANTRVASERASSKRVASQKELPLEQSKLLTELELIDAVQDSDEYGRGHDGMSDWERGFIRSVRSWVLKIPDKEIALSEKQRQVLLKICIRIDIPLKHPPTGLYSPPPILSNSFSPKASWNPIDDDDDIPF